MSDPRDSRRDDPSAALDATIARNAEIVKRGRKERGFLKRLGLSLPVRPDDVKQAYYAKARQTHPDHKGDATEFRKVQEAFDEAVAYAEKNGKRLPWLGAQLPIYLAQRNVIDLVEQWGGAFELQRLDWLEETVGADFSLLADRLRAIDLTDCAIGDAEFHQLLADSDGVPYLEFLSLAGTQVTDASVIAVTRTPSLRRLDVRRTQVSGGLRRRLLKRPQVDEVLADGGLFSWLFG